MDTSVISSFFSKRSGNANWVIFSEFLKNTDIMFCLSLGTTLYLLEAITKNAGQENVRTSGGLPNIYRRPRIFFHRNV
jgi:hypothetical protein